jgi:predicted nucleic acid-binding protein
VIFADTSFWVAFRNRRDNWHNEATQLLRRHERGQLVTTNHIRGETWTFLCRRVGHAAAVGFLDDLEQSAWLRLVTVSNEAEERALAWLRRHDEREYSFVDATSFAVMHSLRIQEALAFDGDFTAAGFQELRL